VDALTRPREERLMFPSRSPRPDPAAADGEPETR
jgi:hypothetical protein